MAGAKQAFEFELTNDQMAFIRSAKNRFNIPDESKVVRIVVDYLLSSPDSHESVFTEPRCLRCD